MKNKAIMWTIIILVSVALFTLGFILINLAIGNDEPVNNNNTVNEGNQNTLPEEEKPQNIVPTSNIGTKILSILKVPNLYSGVLNVELEGNGISSKYMRTYAFVQMMTNTKYSSYLRQSEEYVGDYVTANDLKSIAKKLFTNATNLLDGEVLIEDVYDSKKMNYVLVPKGFAGNSLDYIIEVPYEIKEYSDRVEVYMYKIYATRASEQKEDNEVTVDNIYYDLARKNLASKITDEKMYDEESQISFMAEKINDNTIDKNRVKKVKVTLIKDGANYCIQKYE